MLSLMQITVLFSMRALSVKENQKYHTAHTKIDMFAIFLKNDLIILKSL